MANKKQQANPQAVKDAILSEAKRLVAQGISDADFRRMQRSALGRRIRGLDSFESTCFRLCAYHFSHFDYFEIPAVYQQVKAEDLRQFLQTVVTEDRMCLTVINPKEVSQ